MSKYQESHGERFIRDDRTNYYYSVERYGEKKSRKAMHRRVWELENGLIPKGMHIHHIDGDKSNNHISNLELISPSEHLQRHNKEWNENPELLARKKENLIKNVIPKAAEWHKSEEGRKWHVKQYAETKDRLHAKEKLNCIQCETIFDGQKGKDKYCSNKCKSKWRRAQGLNLEERSCIICQKVFNADKYKNTATCSSSCSAKKRWNDRKAAN